MKEELIKQLIETISGTKEFVLSQAPDIIRQIVIFGYFINISAVLLSVFGAYAARFFIRKGIKKKDEFDALPYYAAAAMILLISVIFFICGNAELFKLVFAKKVYLLEHLKGYLP